ncbi:MAG: hypothetical protein H6Q16_1012 [Bacteroidetes bacterium]|nr:hypothetical protein [Bacteroidota bacterium]
MIFINKGLSTKIIDNKFKYKYDSKGNWITRTIYNYDMSIKYITKRKIKYYDE